MELEVQSFCFRLPVVSPVLVNVLVSEKEI